MKTFLIALVLMIGLFIGCMQPTAPRVYGFATYLDGTWINQSLIHVIPDTIVVSDNLITKIGNINTDPQTNEDTLMDGNQGWHYICYTIVDPDTIYWELNKTNDTISSCNGQFYIKQ